MKPRIEAGTRRDSRHSRPAAAPAPLPRMALAVLAATAIWASFCSDWIAPATGSEVQKIAASDGGTRDWFGTSVAVDSGVALVGAPYDDFIKIDAGSVYVYRFDGNAWPEVQRLRASDSATDDIFGTAVSISGDVAVIGAPARENPAEPIGAAYVFRHDGSTWVEEQKLTPGDGAGGDSFGFSVSVSGDVVVVGSSLHDASGRDSGSAYVYRFDGSNWTEEAKLTPGDNALFDYAGDSVAVDGDAIVIGAFGDDDLGSYSGAAYVYRHDGVSWVEEQKLTASDGDSNDWFGDAVDIHGDRIVVGAPFDEYLGTAAGAAYVFRHDGASWVEETKLLITDGAPQDRTATSVSLDDDVVVLSVLGSDWMGTDTGAAHVFRFDGRAWIEEARLTASDFENGDLLGHGVATHGGDVIVGSPFDDDRAIDAGSAYIFATDPCRAGSVHAGQGLVQGVLRINGSLGDGRRTVSLPQATALTITMDSAAAGPDPGAFVLYGWLGEPSDSTYSVQPYGLGVMCFPSFLSIGVPKPTVTWNNLGYPALLGAADYPSVPAPSTVLARSQGIRQAVTVTFQGIIQDQGSAADGPGSLTNAVILEVLP